MIIDCHGHYTTAPKALETWRNQQIAGIQDPAVMPKVADLKISDDELRESIETNQLRLMKERGSDLTIFSPRASFMAHHIGDFNVSATWSAICNELCFRVSQLFPDHFIPAAMLPQSPGVDPDTCIPELVKCVEQFGNVAINLNPDPSGGHWTSPPLSDRHWYPIYEKMVEYDIPAMIHVSTSCNACFHTTGAHYLNADTTAFMQCLTSDLFKDFPTLSFPGILLNISGVCKGLTIQITTVEADSHASLFKAVFRFCSTEGDVSADNTIFIGQNYWESFKEVR